MHKYIIYIHIKIYYELRDYTIYKRLYYTQEIILCTRDYIIYKRDYIMLNSEIILC